MNWGATIGTGIVGAVAGSAGMFTLALLWVRWFHVSSFEGKAGYFVILLALAGAVAGLVVAMVAARVGRTSLGPDASAWASQLGVGVGTVVCGLLLALGASSLLADRGPDLGVKGVAIAWEVRLPKPVSEGAGPVVDKCRDPRLWTDEELWLQLVGVRGGRPVGCEYGHFDRGAFRQEDGQWILPACVGLFASKYSLCVNLKLGGRDDGFWPPIRVSEAKRRASADVAAEAWSDWYRTNNSRDKKIDADAVMYRFRLV